MSSLPFTFPGEEARKAFFDDFLQVQSTISNPAPDSTNPAFRSKYISLEALLADVRPLLNQHNFILTQTFDREENVLSTYLIHKSGGMLNSQTAMPLDPSPQKVVTYSTYLRRVQLGALLGIRDQDDDGNQASGVSSPTAQTSSVPRPIPQRAQGISPAPSPAPVPQPNNVGGVETAVPSPPPPSSPPSAPGRNGSDAPGTPKVPTPPPAPAPSQNAIAQDTITGDVLAESQNILDAIQKHWGSVAVEGVLKACEISGVEQMTMPQYATFVEGAFAFVASNGRKMILDGPEGNNQVRIQ